MQVFDILTVTISLVVVMVIFMLLFIMSGIKVVKEWDRVAVLRLGKFYRIKGPGIIWLTPMLDKAAMTVSLKEQQTTIVTGEYITSDGSRNRLTGYISWRIIHVQKVVLAVENYRQSIFNVVHHHVLKIGKSFPGDTIMMDEDSLYVEIKKELEPTLTSWGIKILEIKLKSTSEWDHEGLTF